MLTMGFVNRSAAQDYSYQLTITSLGEDQQHFDLEIKSTTETSSEPTILNLSDQITPFEMSLEAGEHTIMVIKSDDQGQIKSSIMGLRNGENVVSAYCDDDKALLTAGPGGYCSATWHK
jgi:hypothetical protein